MLTIWETAGVTHIVRARCTHGDVQYVCAICLILQEKQFISATSSVAPGVKRIRYRWTVLIFDISLTKHIVGLEVSRHRKTRGASWTADADTRWIGLGGLVLRNYMKYSVLLLAQMFCLTPAVKKYLLHVSRGWEQTCVTICRFGKYLTG